MATAKEQEICVRCNPKNDELGLCQNCFNEEKEQQFVEKLGPNQGILVQMLQQRHCKLCDKILRISHYGVYNRDKKTYCLDCLSITSDPSITEVIIHRKNFDKFKLKNIVQKQKIIENNSKIKIIKEY